MEKVYVSVVYLGSYEDKEFRISYAGVSLEKAKETVIKECFRDGDITKGIFNGEINSIDVQHWEDGKLKTTENIY